MVECEVSTGLSIFRLIDRVAKYQATLTELKAVILAGLSAADSALCDDEVAKWIFEVGVPKAADVATEFLMRALDGGAAIAKKAKSTKVNGDTKLDYAEYLGVAVGQWHLPPREFWAMTMIEFCSATAALIVERSGEFAGFDDEETAILRDMGWAH